MKPIYRIVPLLLIASLSGCAAFSEHAVGRVDNELRPCGAWPRCVSSVDTDAHAIPAISLKRDVAAAWPSIRQAVAEIERATVVAEDGFYLHAEITSPWNFYTDDLELLGRAGDTRLSVRSTGRLGYYDFQVNRKRVEALRALLVARGVADR